MSVSLNLLERAPSRLQFRLSIRKKILSTAIGLIALMIITAALSMIMSGTVGYLLRELNDRYLPAYNNLVTVNLTSYERALVFRQMVIAKMQMPPDEALYTARLQAFRTKNREVEQAANSARALINAIIEDKNTPSDNASLARIDSRIESAMEDTRKRLAAADDIVIGRLESGDFEGARKTLMEVDALRAQFMDRIDRIRYDMLGQVFASSMAVINKQTNVLWISAAVTGIAALIGLFVAFLVSSGITRAIRLLLQGTREVEAGHYEKAIAVKTSDEIGDLSNAFNRMVQQLRQNERIRETFGRYVDPRIVRGLIDQPDLGADGERRVMTVLFCDMKGFTKLSENVTPQGLVKLMNRYLTTMSEPIRDNRGIIDKYIGDAIMAYWGPPFVNEDEQFQLAMQAALAMCDRVAELRTSLPELLGVRSISAECDVRIGVATGEVLVGSIGSQFMMNYTVMGDAVNLASRLESANKYFGTRILASGTSVSSLDGDIEMRELDRLIVVGQTHAEDVFEIMGRKEQLSPAQLKLKSQYAEGLAAYRARNWDEARRSFAAALVTAPDDGPSMVMMKRLDSFAVTPPPADWDGAWQLDGK